MKALLLIDIQNDFMPGGALAVTNADEIIPIVNELMPQFELIVATQDWHPADHGSFAANHPGREIFEQIDLAACLKHCGRCIACKTPAELCSLPASTHGASAASSPKA